MKLTLTQRLMLAQIWFRLKHDFQNWRRALNGKPPLPYRKPDLSLRGKFKGH